MAVVFAPGALWVNEGSDSMKEIDLIVITYSRYTYVGNLNGYSQSLNIRAFRMKDRLLMASEGRALHCVCRPGRLTID